MKKLIWIIPILFISFIFFFSSLDATTSEAMSDPLAIHTISFFQLDIDFDLITYIIRKCAHFIEYMTLGLMIVFSHKFSPLFKSNFTYTLFAFVGVIDENIQRFSEGRSCQISDMILDSFGYIFGLGIGILLLRILKRKGN